MLPVDSGLVARRAHRLTDGRLIFFFARLIGENVFVHEEVDSTCRIQMSVNRSVFMSATLHIAELVFLAYVVQYIVIFAVFTTAGRSTDQLFE